MTQYLSVVKIHKLHMWFPNVFHETCEYEEQLVLAWFKILKGSKFR